MKSYLPWLLTGLLSTPALAQTTAPNGGAAPVRQGQPGPAGHPDAGAPKPLLVPTAPRGMGRISGTVLDGTTKKPVEFATVALLPATGTTPLDGTVCDEKGRFALKGLAPGTYRVQLSFLGYATRLEPVTVTEGLTDMGVLPLAASTQKLGEVTVTGEREIVETRPDRIVYNADRDLTNAGGTAADVLRKVPLVNVDGEGNVELRGSGNVRVLINNKPSGIVASSVADAMKQIPADQIKSVEVITTPSAKYDAEGTAGIINIILKKNSLQGTNGSVGLAAGTRSSNGNLSLNHRQGKVGLSSSASGFAFYSPNRNDLDRQVESPLRSHLVQRGHGRTVGGGGFGRLSLDYDPAKYHSLTLSVQGNLFRNQGTSTLFNQFDSENASLNELYTRDVNRHFHTQSYDVSGAYTRTFEQARREWSILAQHTRNRNTQNYTLDQYPDTEADRVPRDYRENSDNLSRNLETTLQTDYTHPFSDTKTLETGAKAILRRVSSDYTVLTSPGDDNFQPNVARSNVFDYAQNVLAAYGTYGFNAGKKTSFRLGTRVEHTDISAQFQQGDESHFTQHYTNVLPNLSVSYAPGKPGQTLRLAYSRRIQRPQIFYLNPFVNRADRANISYGYPGLDPEFTDSYELGYNTFVKGSVISASLYARRTNNAIESYRFVDKDGINNTTFRNIGSNGSYGLSLFGSMKPLPKWEISGNTTFYYVLLQSQVLQARKSQLMYALNLNSSYKFNKGLSLQFFGGINSPRVQLQGRTASWSFYGVGLRKNLLKDKADLSLNADNFLQATRNLRTTLASTAEDNRFTQVSNNYIYLRGIRVAFNYRFGKVENRPQRPKKSIRNDDTKQGESGQGQQ